MPLEVARSYAELVNAAKEAEQNDETDAAAKLYERAIKLEPHEEFPYRRLMILYRKRHQYEDELRVIEKGILEFRNLHRERTARLLKKNAAAKKLSQSLAKSLGLTDNKGTSLFEPEPVESWLKRKQLVEKKLGMETFLKKKPAKKKTGSRTKTKTAAKKPAGRTSKSKR